jgi:hypothetical protein
MGPASQSIISDVIGLIDEHGSSFSLPFTTPFAFSVILHRTETLEVRTDQQDRSQHPFQYELRDCTHHGIKAVLTDWKHYNLRPLGCGCDDRFAIIRSHRKRLLDQRVLPAFKRSKGHGRMKKMGSCD